MANVYDPFAGRTGPFNYVLPGMLSPSTQLSGTGSPEGQNEGVPGQTFVDISNNDLYLKISGTQTTGWKKIGTWLGTGTGGSGGGQISTFRSTIDPTGVVQCVGPGFCIGDGPLIGKLWVKSTAATNSTDWFLMIG